MPMNGVFSIIWNSSCRVLRLWKINEIFMEFCGLNESIGEKVYNIRAFSIVGGINLASSSTA